MLEHRALVAAVAAASALAFAGCSDDDEPLPEGERLPTQFQGVYADSSSGGRVDITVFTPEGRLSPATPPPTPNAFGTMSPGGGGVVNLTGYYSLSSYPSLSLLGGGYTLIGDYGGGFLVGSTTGPTGSGLVRGIRASDEGAGAYCGTFHSEAGAAHGRMGFALNQGIFYGVAFGQGDSAGYYLVGGTTGTGPELGIIFDGAIDLAHHFSGTGTLSTSTGTVQGRWYRLLGGAPTDSGTWTGSECPAGTTGP